jgi:hypothetical protein
LHSWSTSLHNVTPCKKYRGLWYLKGCALTCSACGKWPLIIKSNWFYTLNHIIWSMALHSYIIIGWCYRDWVLIDLYNITKSIAEYHTPISSLYNSEPSQLWWSFFHKNQNISCWWTKFQKSNLSKLLSKLLWPLNIAKLISL